MNTCYVHRDWFLGSRSVNRQERRSCNRTRQQRNRVKFTSEQLNQLSQNPMKLIHCCKDVYVWKTKVNLNSVFLPSLKAVLWSQRHSIGDVRATVYRNIVVCEKYWYTRYGRILYPQSSLRGSQFCTLSWPWDKYHKQGDSFSVLQERRHWSTKIAYKLIQVNWLRPLVKYDFLTVFCKVL